MQKESSIITEKPVRYRFEIDGVFQDTYTEPSGWLGFIWKSSGAETPNFHKTKRGLLPANPYVTERQEFTENSMEGYVTGGTHVWTYESDSGLEAAYMTQVTPEYLQELRNRHNLNYDKALQAATSALATRYFDLGTFIGELRSTLATFRGLAERFLTLLTRTNASNLANAWLEYRYAWRPLYSDMVSFTKAVATAKSLPGTVYKERAGDSSVLTEESSIRVQNVRVTSRVLSRLSIRGTAETLIEPARFRVAPLTTGWELVTFSFIVDWFLSVGSALAAFEASIEFPDLQTSGGFYHTYRIETIVDDFQHAELSGHISGRHVLLGYRKERFPLNPSYVPSFQFNMDIAKLIDLILITLKFRRVLN